MDIFTLKTPYYGNGISTHFCVKKWYVHCTREKIMDWGTNSSFSPKSLWKCPIYSLRDFSFILCKNEWKKWWPRTSVNHFPPDLRRRKCPILCVIYLLTLFNGSHFFSVPYLQSLVWRDFTYSKYKPIHRWCFILR